MPPHLKHVTVIPCEILILEKRVESRPFPFFLELVSLRSIWPFIRYKFLVNVLCSSVKTRDYYMLLGRLLHALQTCSCFLLLGIWFTNVVWEQCLIHKSDSEWHPLHCQLVFLCRNGRSLNCTYYRETIMKILLFGKMTYVYIWKR